MSGLLAGKVWHSGLAPELKPLAAALADIGDHDGAQIYPSVQYVAWLLGRSARAVQYGLAELKKLGVLVIVEESTGGRGKTTEYAMIETALPERDPWLRNHATVAQFADEETMQPLRGKRRKRVKPASRKGCNLRQERVKPTSPDPLVDPLEEPSVITITGADAPSQHELPIPKAAKSPEDFTIWNLGLKALAPSFPREQQSRSFLARQVKDYGKPLVVQAVIAMLANPPLNPSEYLVKTLQEINLRERGGRVTSGSVGKFVPGPSSASQHADIVVSRMEFQGMDLDEALKATPAEMHDKVRVEIQRREAAVAQHCRELADHVRKLSKDQNMPLEMALERGIGQIDSEYRTMVALMLSGEFMDQQPDEAAVHAEVA